MFDKKLCERLRQKIIDVAMQAYDAQEQPSGKQPSQHLLPMFGQDGVSEDFKRSLIRSERFLAAVPSAQFLPVVETRLSNPAAEERETVRYIRALGLTSKPSREAGTFLIDIASDSGRPERPRGAAIEALGALGCDASRDVPVLLKLATETDERGRHIFASDALHGIREYGQDASPWTRDVRELAEKEDFPYCTTAVWTLGEIATDEDLLAILQPMLGGSDDKSRQAAMALLNRFPDDPDIIKAVLEMRGRIDPRKAESLTLGLVAVAEKGQATALESIDKLLPFCSNSEIANRVIPLVLKHGAVTQDNIEDFLLVCGSAHEGVLKEHAPALAAVLGQCEAAWLYDLYFDEKRQLPRPVFDALAEQLKPKTPEAVATLLKDAVSDDRKRSTRAKALLASMDTLPGGGFEILGKLLAMNDGSGEYAYKILQKMGPAAREMAPAIWAIVKDKKSNPWAAMSTLLVIDPDSKDRLLEMALASDDQVMALSACWALLGTLPPEEGGVWQKLAYHAYLSDVRARLPRRIQVLMQTSRASLSPETVAVLRKLNAVGLADEDPGVRAAAIIALGRIAGDHPDEESGQILAAINSDDPQISAAGLRAAGLAIKNIPGLIPEVLQRFPPEDNDELARLMLYDLHLYFREADSEFQQAMDPKMTQLAANKEGDLAVMAMGILAELPEVSQATREAIASAMLKRQGEERKDIKWFMAAFRFVQRHGGPARLAPVLQFYMGEKVTSSIKRSAIRAIGGVGPGMADETTLAMLAQLLRDEDEIRDIQAACIDALSQLGPKGAATLVDYYAGLSANRRSWFFGYPKRNTDELRAAWAAKVEALRETDPEKAASMEASLRQLDLGLRMKRRREANEAWVREHFGDYLPAYRR